MSEQTAEIENLLTEIKGGWAGVSALPAEMKVLREQKDTAREVVAKLASLRGIVWVGLGLFLFGLATLFYPPLKVLIGSVTSAAMVLGGVALMVLPSLVVGNEVLILGGVGVAVGGWFLAHRHGQLRGAVEASSKGNDNQAGSEEALP
jgi:hypothetical protein